MFNAPFESRASNTAPLLVAIVDDDDDILELVSVHLKKAGMKVKELSEGEQFYRFLQQDRPDLVILDLMLPDADGMEICKFLRGNERFSTIPIVMLTARADEVDRVLGLELGADDYVIKPFSPKELVARVKAVLRRSQVPKQEAQVVEIGKLLRIDLGRHEVLVDGKRVEVTGVEFRILQLLASRPGWVFSRESILNFLWGDEKVVLDRTVDVHVRHVREKLGPAARMIKNVRGIGYRLET